MITIRLNIDATKTQLGLTIEMVELVNEIGDGIKDKWLVTIGLIFFDIEILV
jgi:hypothetical protein